MRFFAVLGLFACLSGCATASTVSFPDDGGTPPVDGASDTATDAPCTTKCGGTCTNTQTDSANCGTCGNACSSGATCVSGACQCTASATKCGSACIDTKVDAKNCGACGNDCTADGGAPSGGGTWACVNSACIVNCTPPKTVCNGGCADTKTDNANCGVCGTACQLTETCTAGLCCTTGQNNCSNVCSDPNTDAKNCGVCGTVCGVSTPNCVSGKCVACNNKVLILGDSGTVQNAAFLAKVNAAGMVGTVVDNGMTTYSGTPAASGFSAVLLMDGLAYTTDMPSAGQQAIVTAQGAGTGVVFTEWAPYHVYSSQWATLKSLSLFTYTTGAGPVTMTFTLTQANHPIWTGLPNSFATTSPMGCSGGTITNGGTKIATNASCPTGGVLIRTTPGGRIVYLPHTANWNNNTTWVNDMNIVMLTTNALKWATGCLL